MGLMPTRSDELEGEIYQKDEEIKQLKAELEEKENEIARLKEEHDFLKTVKDILNKILHGRFPKSIAKRAEISKEVKGASAKIQTLRKNLFSLEKDILCIDSQFDFYFSISETPLDVRTLRCNARDALNDLSIFRDKDGQSQ